MPMFDLFEKYIQSEINISDDDLQLLRSKGTEKKMRRKELLLHEGEISRHKSFVCRGMLRTFRVNPDGSESIMRFSPENTWSLDPQSYNAVKPTRYTIEAMEDAWLIQWSKGEMESLFDRIPALKMYSDKLREESYDTTQNRVLANISLSAEEKYQDFIDTHPGVFLRVPLHMVASYIGVSRETLSRIRQAQVRQK
ncbi:MAG: Crp/Fnr family transcriptional regulator [Chitinophagaceae bacterium]|nr:MAG: Crp/Fnr family transcriptional regulator [Chitinophagaceae bacterium]